MYINIKLARIIRVHFEYFRTRLCVVILEILLSLSIYIDENNCIYNICI